MEMLGNASKRELHFYCLVGRHRRRPRSRFLWVAVPGSPAHFSLRSHGCVQCLNGFWNFAFFISALVVWGACYYDPCEEGKGLADSMDVDGQMSFTCFTTAVTFMAHTGCVR